MLRKIYSRLHAKMTFIQHAGDTQALYIILHHIGSITNRSYDKVFYATRQPYHGALWESIYKYTSG